MRRFSSTARIFVLLLTTCAFVSVNAEVRERIGYAYDKQTGNLIYSETHREVMENGRLVGDTVIYRDADGNVFAEKYINFRKNLVMPDFHLVNADNGHVEGARASDEQFKIHFRAPSDTGIRQASVMAPSNGIVDAGFDRFIEQHWDALVSGKTLEREFLIPSQLEFYTFEIEKGRERPAGEYVFKLHIKSGFLKLFVSPVLVHYDARTRQLLRYEGISNIRNEDGENFEVRIEFPASNRMRVDARGGAPVS